MNTVRDEMRKDINAVILPNGECVYLVQVMELIQALDKLCYAYRKATGLDGAWDTELLTAQDLLNKLRGNNP